MWSNYNPHPILDAYLAELGIRDQRRDLRDVFFELEEKGTTNIERFMEFAWENRDRNFPISQELPPGYIYGVRIQAVSPTEIKVGGGPPPTFWENLLYHGLGNPLSFYMGRCFFENGAGWRSFDLTKSVAARLNAGDFVLNLNYDTVFEIALTQMPCAFAYSPNPPANDEIIVCKPHGSLNMVSDHENFSFGEPTWLGIPEDPKFRSFSGLIPPRLNKRYDQHPIAKVIFDSARHRRPQKFAMWGVGLTDSDADLVQLYSSWAKRAGSIDIINPASEVADKAKALFRCDVRHFETVSDWLGHGSF